MSRTFQGIKGAPGIAIGPLAYIKTASAASESLPISADEAPARFNEARALTIKQLSALGAELRDEGKAEEAGIFDAQAQFASDPTLEAEVLQRIAKGVDLPAAILEASGAMATMLAQLDDPYLRERAADVRAVGEQIAATVRGETAQLTVAVGAIVVAANLTVAQIAMLRKQQIAGIATTSGTATGHVAILARALELPAVVGLGTDIVALTEGTPTILDADRGILIVEPTSHEHEEYTAQVATQQAERQDRAVLRTLPAQTSDGYPIQLWANIGHPDEVANALEHGATGIGLFRTEFLFLDRSTMPDEEEQVRSYHAVLQAMNGQPVVIRTLDIGGDKPLPYLPQLAEENPFLGTRGIRFSMRHPELFQIQLRALLRAATSGDLRIMVPMVSTIADVRWAVEQIMQAVSELTRQNQRHRADVPFGIMVETPAAALMLDQFKPLISFCSVGSNDLSQYTLAVDRTNGELATQYAHTDPAVLRLIEIAAQSAGVLDLPISVCGELAADPALSVVLVGMGITTLSMAAPAISIVKAHLQTISLDAALVEARRAIFNTE